MIIVGIDAGISGAICVYDFVNNKVIDIIDFPTYEVTMSTKVKGSKKFKKRRKVDCYKFACIMQRLRSYDQVKVYLEEVHSMPRDSVVAAFSFGEVFGICKMALAAFELNVDMIPPMAWKKEFDLIKCDKEDGRLKAIEVLPLDYAYFARKKDHNRADAALIALYGSSLISESDYMAANTVALNRNIQS